MFRIAPWVKILCSYRAIRLPRLNGVISRSRMELVGRLPSNTLNGATCLTSSGVLPCAANSASTTSSDLPNASASVCAKKFDSSLAWWSLSGLWLMAGAIKSQGTSLVP
ncbi:hypothetical protein D3C78_1380920 [compost metagenome]